MIMVTKDHAIAVPLEEEWVFVYANGKVMEGVLVDRLHPLKRETLQSVFDNMPTKVTRPAANGGMTYTRGEAWIHLESGYAKVTPDGGVDILDDGPDNPYSFCGSPQSAYFAQLALHHAGPIPHPFDNVLDRC